MKSICLIALSILSLSTFSCPDFSGKYSCSEVDNQGGSDFFTLDIKQSGNVFDISLNGEESEELIADGVPRINDIIFVEGTIAAGCSANRLVLWTNSEIVFDRDTLNMLSSTEITKVDGILYQKTQTVIGGSSQTDSMVTTATCTEI